MSLDEVYGILKTHELEVQQRKARMENRLRSLALRASARKDKKKSYAEKPRNQIRNQVSDIDILSDTDDSSGDYANESSDEAKMQEIMACIVYAFHYFHNSFDVISGFYSNNLNVKKLAIV